MNLEKRLLLAVALSFVALVLWQYVLFPVKPPPEAPAETPAPAVETAQVEPPEPSPAGAAAEQRPPTAAERVETVTVETDLFAATFTNQGARVRSWRLKKDYLTSEGLPLELVPDAAVQRDQLPFALDFDHKALSERVNSALYEVTREEIPAEAAVARGERVRFTWADGSGLQVVKTLEFHDGDYLVEMRVEVTRGGVPERTRVTWGPGFAARDADPASRYHYLGQAVVNDAGIVHRFGAGARIASGVEAVSGETKQDPARLLWAGLEEQYFAALLLPAAPAGPVLVRAVEMPPHAGAQAKATHDVLVAVPVPAEGAKLFVGPKKLDLLRSLDTRLGGGRGLETVVWFSNWGPIAWVARHLLLALIWVHDHVVPNYGATIIVVTLIMRLLLFPLNQYSMVNMRRMQSQMQRIQPKMNAIKAKYKKKDAETRAKMNQEMMALYQKEGINPMGSMSGCLPVLAQFPILIAFYDVLTTAVELRQAPFVGWIHDLTRPDPYYITPILMGASMFAQQKMSTTKTTDPAQRQQQMIMLMMPIVFTGLFVAAPAGLVLYWFVNNLLGIGQQWLVNRHLGRLEAAAQKA